MKCSKCVKKAIYPKYCSEHFVKYFEKKVFNTIKKFDLIEKKDKTMIAVSGGKDSLTVLYLVNKFFGNVTALAIDEGIKYYREHTLKDLKLFCNEYKIPLKIVAFEKEFGSPLDKMIKKTKFKPCHICGTFRRYLLNKHSKGYDKIITGHNLDDECQSVLVNLFRGNVELLARLGPKSGLKKYRHFFTQRVKPLYFMREKEVLVYTLIKKFKIKYTECKYTGLSYRATVRDLLNEYENNHKGTKENIINNFINILPKLKKKFATSEEPNLCMKCDQPSRGEICKACELYELV